jgi:GNAT superfamily N-acetyltransferase
MDIPKMTEQQWQDLLDSREEFIKEFRPDEPIPSQQDQRTFISQSPQLRDQVSYWLFYDDEAHCVGYCIIAHPKPESPDYEANKHRIYVEPVVLARYRRQGLGTQLLPLIVSYAQKVGVTWIMWDTKFESGFRFSEKIGAIAAARQRANRLAVDQVDWGMMQQWVDAGRSRNPGVELIRLAGLPDPALIDPICDLITRINLLQPRDEFEGMSYTLTPDEFVKQTERLKERNTERVIYCAREPDQTLSGMSDMYYNTGKPLHTNVGLTGVRSEYQRRGLGKWLKAAMMLDMRARHPEVRFVDTENFNSNAAMLSINERMGFKLFEQYAFYKIRVQDLEAKIKNNA